MKYHKKLIDAAEASKLSACLCIQQQQCFDTNFIKMDKV